MVQETWTPPFRKLGSAKSNGCGGLGEGRTLGRMEEGRRREGSGTVPLNIYLFSWRELHAH